MDYPYVRAFMNYVGVPEAQINDTIERCRELGAPQDVIHFERGSDGEWLTATKILDGQPDNAATLAPREVLAKAKFPNRS